MDGCAIIDARRRESTEPGPLWRANATTTGNVQTGLRKSRLHSGDTEQDMRNALVKSFMCDHYSKTMQLGGHGPGSGKIRDPRPLGILVAPPVPDAPTSGTGISFIDCREERKPNEIRPSHHLPRRRRATRRRNGWRGKGNQEPARQGHQRLRSKRPSSRQTR